MFFKLEKFNYVNLELDLTKVKFITQKELDEAPKKLIFVFGEFIVRQLP
mgnify:CR=1 FL=1